MAFRLSDPIDIATLGFLVGDPLSVAVDGWLEPGGIQATVGALTLLGLDANINEIFIADVGSLLLSGKNITVSTVPSNTVVAILGALALLGQNADINEKFIADVGSLFLSGENVNILLDNAVFNADGSFRLIGDPVIESINVDDLFRQTLIEPVSYKSVIADFGTVNDRFTAEQIHVYPISILSSLLKETTIELKNNVSQVSSGYSGKRSSLKPSYVIEMWISEGIAGPHTDKVATRVLFSSPYDTTTIKIYDPTQFSTINLTSESIPWDLILALDKTKRYFLNLKNLSGKELDYILNITNDNLPLDFF